MKNTIYILAIALIMGACTYKNEPIALKPYEAKYNSAISQEKTPIYIESIKDQRADKNVIGYSLKNGKKKLVFFSNENFEKKYKDALLYALNISGFNTSVSQNDASLVINVYIKDIELIKTDESFSENLKGKILIELVVKSGNTTTKHNFTQKAGKWMGPSHKSKDLEPFLATLFEGSIDSITSKLAE